MWLKFGVDADNHLIAVEDAPSGKTNLTCPYCGGGLTAKKGRIKAHHFAHTEETCYPVAKRSFPMLPLYDNFNIRLSGKHLQQLKQLWHEYGDTDYSIPAVPFRRILQLKLYFLQVRADGETLHKIGVTRRAIEERVAEVEQDLRKHYRCIDIQVLGTWEHRGNVELYFKHRYQRFNHPIGTLTEYFQFEEVEPVLSDLYQMRTKALGDEELEVLHNEASLGT